jgi:hypothetical protein
MTRKTDVNRWAAVARWAVAIGIVMASIAFELDTTDTDASITLLVAVAVFWLLKLKARQEQKRMIDAAELRTHIGAVGKEEGVWNG